MEGVADDLLVSAARQLKGRRRRIFLADVCDRLCTGSPRKTEERFGWGRETVAKGLLEKEGVEPDPSVSTPSRRGRQRSEEANPQLAIDIRLIVEPHTHRYDGFLIRKALFWEKPGIWNAVGTGVRTSTFPKMENPDALSRKNESPCSPQVESTQETIPAKAEWRHQPSRPESGW